MSQVPSTVAADLGSSFVALVQEPTLDSDIDVLPPAADSRIMLS